MQTQWEINVMIYSKGGSAVLWGQKGIPREEWEDRIQFMEIPQNALFLLIESPWAPGEALHYIHLNVEELGEKYDALTKYLTKYLIGKEYTLREVGERSFREQYLHYREGGILPRDQLHALPGTYGWLEHAPLPESLHDWLRNKAQGIYRRTYEY